jgi:hypothetical protein
LVYVLRSRRVVSDFVLITDPAGDVVGSGTYAPLSGNESFVKHPTAAETVLAAEATGFPRASKVLVQEEFQGHGYATVTYTALVLGAWMKSHRNDGTSLAQARREAVEGLKMNVLGAGISSNFNRSSDADVWWDRAKDLGIAYEEDVEVESQEEQFSTTISLRSERSLRSRLLDALGDEDIYEVSRLDDITVEGTQAPGGGEGTADVYAMNETSRATGARRLVLFTCAAPVYDAPSLPGGIPLRHVPELTGWGVENFNRELAPLLNLADTNVYIQNALREVYESRREGRLFEQIREDTIGAQYDTARGYLENPVSKSSRRAYEDLNIAAYAELPG